MLADRREITKRLPHAGSMCLLDEVVEIHGAHISCGTRTHKDRNNPLRSVNGLRATVALEYAVQAMAWIKRGGEFQLWHALALFGLTALSAGGVASRWLTLSAWAMQVGILLFCGTLYWLGLFGMGSLGSLAVLTPIGGLALMASWAFLVAASLSAVRR